MNYPRLNNLIGWLVFAITLIVYVLTAAPTASFWDCGEFIAVSNELQVPHPPGAPLYLMIGRLFAMLASDASQVAFMVNLLSGVSSAFAVLFTFWIITILAKKIVARNIANPDRGQQIAIFGAGAVGALSMAWADTFWFSAVEAEVYAMSSMFICLVYWLMLKWEARADEPDNLKWLVLVFYVLGLSIGVHLMALVILPGLGMIYYFRRYTFSWGGLLASLAISLGILIVIQYGVIQFSWDIAGRFELFMVGTFNPDTQATSGLGLPMGSGFLLFTLLLVGGLAYGLWVAQKRSKPLLSTALLGLVMVYLGFTSYTMIYLRSNANPPIDENNPENIISMLSYLKREQYGDRPLFYGAQFNSRPVALKEKNKTYIVKPGQDRYVFDRVRQDYEYEANSQRFLPRMHIADPKDVYAGGLSPFLYINYASSYGNPQDIYSYKITGKDNMAYMLEYQFGHMFFRYFLWNFVGRESDEQWGDYDWESGLNFNKLADLPDYRRNSATRNHYYFLPLLIGLLGMFFHFQRDNRQASALMMMWLMAGLGIAFFLNMGPQEPRERDYAFVGAIQLFCVWIGLGVLQLADLLRKPLKGAAPMAATGVAFLASPFLLIVQNWDDHNRSGQYVAPDSAWNLLNSCKPNAIIFTNGDNDTFPLWYLQEVEGVRPDVRVVNLSLANTDWYLIQMKMPHNGSLPVPISFTEDYILGERNQVARVTARDVAIPVHKADVLKLGIFDTRDSALVADTFRFSIRPNARYGGILRKDDVIYNIIENVAKDGWKRPVYFATTIAPSNFMGFDKYFQQEGLAYRVVPKKPTEGGEHLAVETMYKNLTEVFHYRGLTDPTVHFDDNTLAMIRNLRYNFFRLCDFVLQERSRLEQQNLILAAQGGQAELMKRNSDRIAQNLELARKTITFAEKNISKDVIPMETNTLMMYARIHHELGNAQQAEEYISAAYRHAASEAQYARSRMRAKSADAFNGTLRDEIRSMEYIVSFYANELKKGDKARAVVDRVLQILDFDPGMQNSYRARFESIISNSPVGRPAAGAQAPGTQPAMP
ncbi:MAG: DUF2723 domain-containing protein [Bacteroidetes bacterium]|nr:DUF2723 domain-containing protein [Bacteroidota bacterium]